MNIAATLIGAVLLLTALLPSNAKGNPDEIEAALKAVPSSQREGMEFLVANMPDADRQT